jgi:integrase
MFPMTLRVRKRGAVYQLEGRACDRGPRGNGERERVRISLGTASHEAALAWHTTIEKALAEGPTSIRWRELRRVLAPEAFEKLAAIVGHVPKDEPEAPKYFWADLTAKFSSWMTQRIATGKLRDSTRARYDQTSAAFEKFLASRGIVALADITRAVVEDFKSWHLARVLAKKHSRGGAGVVLDAAILHRIFVYAVECEMISKNPVRLEGRPGDSPERGAQPFNAAQLAKMRQAAGSDLLAFLLLRWTGLRGSDATGLRWEEIEWETREINRLTMKRRKRVILPIHQELFFALEIERDRRNPQLEDRVLLNPANGQPLTRPRLYERMLALGRRAGVLDSHPHRFRDTLAVDLLARGASPYDVAKLLGDTVETVENHYAPFVRELRERARNIMENGLGLEIAATPRPQSELPKERLQ